MAEPTADATAAHGAESRRDFLRILAMAGGAVGTVTVIWPLIDALNPDAASTARARPIVTISDIAPDSVKTVQWVGLPVLIRRLTDKQLADEAAVAVSSLPDPASVASRVAPGNPHFVVVLGQNTGTPCELEGSNPGDSQGDYGGWVCPCDGSQYDVLGRVRVGPAHRNLVIPRFSFINPDQIQLG